MKQPIRHYYYTTPANSDLGVSLADFINKAHQVAQAADDFAKRVGASAYIQPIEFFEGGVVYLEFAEEPDPNVWTKRTDLGDTPLYEPNLDTSKGRGVACEMLKLPTVNARAIFDLLLYTGKRATETPTFFLHDGRYHIRIQDKCDHPRLSKSNNKIFRTALAAVQKQSAV